MSIKLFLKFFIGIILSAIGIFFAFGWLILLLDKYDDSTILFIITLIFIIPGILLLIKASKEYKNLHQSNRLTTINEPENTQMILPIENTNNQTNSEPFQSEQPEINYIEKDGDIPTPPGAVISYLDACALYFWEGKHTNYKIPQYYLRDAFGKNVGPALQKLLQMGFLKYSNIDRNISLKTVPELKAILSERNLKISGRKTELIQRIIENIPENELNELFPVSVYEITSAGEQAAEPYSIIFESNRMSLGFSYYRLLQEKANNPNKSNEVILAQMLYHDLQATLQKQQVHGFRNSISHTKSFMRQMGELQFALDCGILDYFFFVQDIQTFPARNYDQQNYFLTVALEKDARDINLSLEQLLQRFESVLKSINPFGLATDDNISKTISYFQKGLNIK